MRGALIATVAASLATISAGQALAASQWQVLRGMQSRGIALRRWPPEILVALEQAWHEVVAEESLRNPNFKRVYESYSEFRSNDSIWRHLSYLH